MRGFVRRHLKKAFALGLVVWGILFVSCNLEPNVEYRVDLRLPDSLSSDSGDYDRLSISFELTDGKVINPNVFNGPFLSGASGGVLKDLLIGNSVPDEYVVVIKAFKGDKWAVYKITVSDKSPPALTTVFAFPTPNNGGDSDTVIVIAPNPPNELHLSDTVLILGVTSSPRPIYATPLPYGSSGVVRFTSSEPLVAEVDENGLITPKSLGETQITVEVQGHPKIQAKVRVKVIVPPAITQVAFARPAPTLYVGAPKQKIPVTHMPDSLIPELEFTSSERGIIALSASGEAEAKSEGTATLTVTAVGSSTIRDTLIVQAIKDVPVIDAGITQSVAIGQPVIIKVKVTQAFGTLDLNWDFDADGLHEGATTQDTATVTHTYATKGDYTVTFIAKDGEGNTSTQDVRIRVGMDGPLVIITKPKQDTIVNTPKFTVWYTSDDRELSQEFTLREGLATVLTVKDSNADGVDSASVKVTLDTKAPVIRIKAPTNGFVTNQPDIDVAWTVDSVAQLTKTKEIITGKQGVVSIIRDYTDSAGNYGRDSIAITRDTLPPAAPVFTGSDTITNSKQPVWTWISGSGGNGRFAVQFGEQAPLETTDKTFTPPAELIDSAYTLRVSERDAAGNWSATRSRTITIKTSGALVEITAPKRGSHTNSKSGVIEVAWSVNKAPKSTELSDTLTLEGNWNRIRREFKDSAGNVSFDTMSVFWDTTRPKVAITSPVNGAMVNSLIVPVAWSVDDQGQTTRTADTLTGSDGTKTITRTFTDVAGNTGTAVVTVNLDRVVPATPTVTVAPASPTTDQTPTWSWTGTGPFEYRYGSTNPPTANVTQVGASPFTPATNLAPGTWYFQVRERDAAMNWSAWSAVSAVAIYIPPNAMMPAARQHVRFVDGVAFKYTSKLAKIVELNFTMGFGHQPGKAIIATALDRIATNYSTAALPITVQHFTGLNGGSASGNIPAFTVSDLLGGQVIVANNVSSFGGTALGSQRQDAIRTAIETNGRGYIGIHGSGDNEASGWPWFTGTLHPVSYQGHGSRITAPVYKHLGQAKHVVLQGVLETGTTLAANAPDELALDGTEKLANNVPVRQMKGEWHRFGRDLTRDAATKDKVVPLLKYDARDISIADVPSQFRRLGGNIFTYLYTVGNGLTSFFPSGHENDELLDPNTGFDGGAGDYDRYLAQLMFYLAGYNASACDVSCNGLEVVDENDHQLTGMSYAASGMKGGIGGFYSDVHFYANQVTFTSSKNTTYKVEVVDFSGQLVRQIESKGAVTQVFDAKPITHVFDVKHFNPGVYYLRVTIGNQKPKIKRYVIM